MLYKHYLMQGLLSCALLASMGGAQLKQSTLKDFKESQGMKPKATEFHPGDQLSVMANAYLKPSMGQTESLMFGAGNHLSESAVTYDSFRWCRKYPDRGLEHIQYRFNVPEFDVFTGESLIPQTELCKTVWFQDSIGDFERLIDEHYGWEPSLDKLPAALKQQGRLQYGRRVPLGYKAKADGAYYIYNHADFVIKLGPVAHEEDTYNVVGFEVEPKSIDHDKMLSKESKKNQGLDLRSRDEIGLYLSEKENGGGSVLNVDHQALKAGRRFSFSYSVKFELVEEPTWEHRLDKYMQVRAEAKALSADHSIQWVQLLFIVITLCLSTLALIRSLKSALNKDTQAMREMNQRRSRRTYAEISSFEDAIEDAYEDRQDQVNEKAREQAQRKVAWKRVHAHVFRPPTKPMLLALCLGAGFQSLAMAALTAVMALLLGTQSISGLYMSTFPFFGIVNGFTAARFYAFFNGSRWRTLTFLASCIYPLALFSGYFFVSGVDQEFAEALFGQESISQGTFLFLWLLINVPGTCLGSYHGFTAKKPKVPTKQSRLNRDIPESKGRHWRTFCASILPFVAIYLQFGQFAASSFSQSDTQRVQLTMQSATQVKTTVQEADIDTSHWPIVFFVSLASTLYLVIVAEVTLVQTYLQLCEEDYRWQWQSFKNGACPGSLLFILALVLKLFVARQVTTSLAQLFAQLLTVMIMCGVIGLAGAVVAFTSSLKFNQYLFAKVQKTLD